MNLKIIRGTFFIAVGIFLTVISDDFSKILECIAIVIGFEKIKVEPEDTYEKIFKCVSVIPIIYLLLDTCNYDLVFIALKFIHDYPISVCSCVGLIAILSPASAYIEMKKRGFTARDGYIWKNLLFNLFGTLSSCVMFLIACYIIHDFNVLRDFEIEGIISIFIPSCIAFVLLYQREEQQSRHVTDHDPSIRWVNQVINMLHLFNVYFLAIISSIYIVTYTIYCRIHNIQIEISIFYFIFLQLALIFFYALSTQPHEYLHMILLVDVPAILISSIYWLSWFKITDNLIKMELIFIVFNMCLFTVLIMCRNKIIIVGAGPEPSDIYKVIICYRGKGLWIKNKSGFYFISTIFVILSYAFIWLFPMTTQKIPADDAEKYIIKICSDTEFNAAAVIKKMQESDMYNRRTDDYNRNDYMNYINGNLHNPIVEKGILDEYKKILKYEELIEWYEHP